MNSVTVRPLEWKTGDHDIHFANEAAGGYTICRTGVSVTWCHHESGGWIDAATLDEAKAAAQADYESRVLSALTASPDATSALLAEIERLRGALEPFAEESLFAGPQHEFVTVKRSDCDRARAALKEPTDV